MKRKYKITTTDDGKQDVYQNGDWLGTFDTPQEAQTEVDERQKFDALLRAEGFE